MIIFPSSYSMSLVTNSSYYCYLQRIKQTLSPQHHTHKGNPILFMHIKRSFQEVMYNVKKTILSCYGCMCTLGHKSHRPHSLYYMNYYLCMYTSIVFCCDWCNVWSNESKVNNFNTENQTTLELRKKASSQMRTTNSTSQMIYLQRRQNPLQLTNNGWKLRRTDQWLLTNFTQVLKPIPSCLNWPISFNGPDC